MSVNPEQQTRQETPESGLRFDRCWFIREDENGEPPADPDWQLYSDRLVESEGSLNPGLERLDALGTPDPSDFGRALEENEVTITYSLQRPLVDATGEPVDACYDAFVRNEASQIPNTHTMVGRDNNPSPGPHDPEGVSGQRRYLVMQGGKANVSMEPDATEADPVPVSLTYMGQKVRSYHIYQPASATTLVVQSESPDDTDIDVTIENEGATTSETVTLDGTTAVATSTEFSDVDAFSLSAGASGTVTLHINDDESGDGSDPTAGSTLCEIIGGNSYAVGGGQVDGDRGVPALGAGSVPDPIGEPFEDFGSSIFEFDFPEGVPTPDLQDITVETDNGLEARPQQGSYQPAIEEGNREITIETNVIGERASHDMLRDAYLNRPGMLGWTLARTKFVFPESRCTEPPSIARASDEAYAETGGTWQSIGIELTNVE